MTTLMWIALILTAYIVGLAGLGPPEWLLRWVRGAKDEAEEKGFIEKTVERMKEDPLAVEAVYAQSQYHATNPALVVAFVALLVALLSIEAEVRLVQVIIYIVVAAVLLFLGYKAVALTMDRSQLYARAINRYCEHLGLPRLPK